MLAVLPFVLGEVMPVCNTCKRDVKKCELSKSGGNKKKNKRNLKCLHCEEGIALLYDSAIAFI